GGHHLGDARRLAAHVDVLAGQDLARGVVHQQPRGGGGGLGGGRHRQGVAQRGRLRCSGLRRRLLGVGEGERQRGGGDEDGGEGGGFLQDNELRTDHAKRRDKSTRARGEAGRNRARARALQPH